MTSNVHATLHYKIGNSTDESQRQIVACRYPLGSPPISLSFARVWWTVIGRAGAGPLAKSAMECTRFGESNGDSNVGDRSLPALQSSNRHVAAQRILDRLICFALALEFAEVGGELVALGFEGLGLGDGLAAAAVNGGELAEDLGGIHVAGAELFFYDGEVSPDKG